jgi:hypothetical protein
MISTQNDQGTVTTTSVGLYNKPEMTYNKSMKNGNKHIFYATRRFGQKTASTLFSKANAARQLSS